MIAYKVLQRFKNKLYSSNGPKCRFSLLYTENKKILPLPNSKLFTFKTLHAAELFLSAYIVPYGEIWECEIEESICQKINWYVNKSVCERMLSGFEYRHPIPATILADSLTLIKKVK